LNTGVLFQTFNSTEICIGPILKKVHLTLWNAPDCRDQDNDYSTIWPNCWKKIKQHSSTNL